MITYAYHTDLTFAFGHGGLLAACYVDRTACWALGRCWWTIIKEKWKWGREAAPHRQNNGGEKEKREREEERSQKFAPSRLNNTLSTSPKCRYCSYRSSTRQLRRWPDDEAPSLTSSSLFSIPSMNGMPRERNGNGTLPLHYCLQYLAP